MMLATYLYLGPRLRTNGSTLLLLLYALVMWTLKTLPFTMLLLLLLLLFNNIMFSVLA